MHTHSLPHEFMSYTEEIKRDILSFAQWMVDYNVVPIAIEITLADRENGLAGSIDFIVEMDVQVKEPGEEVYKSGPRKGQKKEVKVNKRMNAIVDLKRGKKGFWQSHELQLIEYFNMWQMNFPDIPIHRLYNLAPMDWKKAPGYKMKDQTHSKAAKKLPHLIQTAKIEDATKNNSLTLCHGEIDIFKGLYANVETIELSELIKRKREFNS